MLGAILFPASERAASTHASRSSGTPVCRRLTGSSRALIDNDAKDRRIDARPARTLRSLMDWKQSCRARLGDHLGKDGDLAPPWEQFPTYERHTIGWRMGAGEDWMGLWRVFVEDLDPAFEVRLAYLKR